MPPFFIPIFAFAIWTLVLFSLLPALRYNFYLSDQLLAPLFFISNLILVLAWPLSGPLTAAVLSFLSAAIAFYFCLGIKEPALFLQVISYGALFIVMVFYLYEVQQKTNNRGLMKEKLSEELNLTRQERAHCEILKDAFERKIDLLLDMQRFSEELKELTTVKETAQKIVNEAYDFIGRADECALYLVDETRQGLVLLATAERRRSEPVYRQLGAAQGTVFDRWVMKRCQAIMVEDVENDFRFTPDAGEDGGGPRSICASALMTENKVLGVIRASAAAPGVFGADDLRLLDILASLGAVTLRNLLLYERMGELAIRDSLTGLYLSRYFLERLKQELRRAVDGKKRFALIMLDIDYFKKYNDEYGHSAGDLVLKNIAAIVQKSLGPADFSARYGGEEFVVLLPGRSLAEGIHVAEELRASIEKNVFLLRRVKGRVTASFGVSAFPEGGRTEEALIRSVDKNLYEAKRQGRNRVCGAI